VGEEKRVWGGYLVVRKKENQNNADQSRDRRRDNKILNVEIPKESRQTRRREEPTTKLKKKKTVDTKRRQNEE